MGNDIIIPQDINNHITVYQDIVNCITPNDILSFKFNNIVFNIVLSDELNNIQNDIDNALIIKNYPKRSIIAEIINNDLCLSVTNKQDKINGVIFADMEVIH